MPDYFINIMFFANKWYQDKLGRLQNALYEQNNITSSYVDFLQKAGIRYEDILERNAARGQVRETTIIGDLDVSDENEHAFLMQTTAEIHSMYTNLIMLSIGYEGVQFVMYYENPSEGIYINTDKRGKYYTTRYKIEVKCSTPDNPAPEGFFADGVLALDVFSSDSYYSTIEELFDYAEECTGRRFSTLAGFEAYLRAAFAVYSGGSGQVAVRTFDTDIIRGISKGISSPAAPSW